MKKLSRRVATLGGGTLLGAAAICTFVHSRQSSATLPTSRGIDANTPNAPDTKEAPVTEEAAQVATPSRSDQACRFHRGDTRAWTFESTVAASLDLRMLNQMGKTDQAVQPAGSKDVTTKTTAILQIEVLDDSSVEGTSLLATLDAVNEETETRVGRLNRPFLLHVATDCSITAFARDAGATVLAARTQQAIAYELSFAVPREDATLFSGRDGIGAYQANIGSGNDADGPFIRRRVLSYKQLWARDDGARKIDRSVLTVRRDQGTWFASMRGSQEVSGGGLTNAKSTVVVKPTDARIERFAHASHDQGAYIWEDLLPHQVTPLVSSKLSAAENEERAKLKDVPLEQAYTRFEAQVATDKNINEQWRGLSTYIEARPEVIPRLRSSLRNNVLPPEERAGAFLALGMARVPEARDALLAINHDSGTTAENRGQSALLLANRNDVTLALAKQFSGESGGVTRGATTSQREYARTAALALGMMAGVHKDTMPGVVDEARGAISNLLSSGKSASDLSPGFGAMGNLGDASAIPDIQQWSRHQDPTIREVVPRAIRRMPFEDVHSLAVDWLGRETYPGVKRELYRVLHGMLTDQRIIVPSDLAALATRDLALQLDLPTRQSIVRILGPAATSDPQVQRALLEQAKLEVGQKTGLYNMIAQYVPGPALASTIQEAERARQVAQANGGTP